MENELTDEQRTQISQALYARQKITAIKLYRDAVRCSLAEAKAFIDQLEEALRKENPNAFRTVKSAGCGATAFLFCLGGITTFYALKFRA